MASQGPNSPGTVTGNGPAGGPVFSNRSNVTAEDGSFAQASLDCQASETLTASSFGFSIPAGATIDGIVVEVKRKSDQTGNMTDNSVALICATRTSADKGDTVTQWPTVNSYATYGGSTDKWSSGAAWDADLTAENINDSGFKLSFSALENCSNADVAYIDHIRITVYYTEAAAGGNRRRRALICGAAA